MIIIIIIIIIISISKKDDVFSIIAILPYGPPVNTDIDYNRTFFGRFLLAHLSRRLKGELIVYPCSGVRRRRQPFSNMNISEVSRPIKIKFYLKHHWDGGKAA